MRHIQSMTGLALILAVTALHAEGVHLSDETPLREESRRIVSKYETQFSRPPRQISKWGACDAPLLGNGELGVCISGAPERQTFWLNKNDFWRLRHGNAETWAVVFGRLHVVIPALKGAGYDVRQALYDARTVSRFTKDGAAVEMVSWVAAMENALVVELRATGKAVDVEVSLELDKGAMNRPVPQESDAGVDTDIFWGSRAFTKEVDIATGAAAAVRVLGAPGKVFTLSPGQKVTVVLGMSTNFDDEDYLAAAKSTVKKIDLKAAFARHQEWWADYWAKSFVEIGDAAIEKLYYVSTYTMGACSRDLRFPPGIIGPWATQQKKIFFCNAYHQNYNFVAPFHGLYICNRLEQADPQDAPLLAFRERGQWYAKNVTETRGILFPISMGPLGMETYRDFVYRIPESNEKGGCFHQQRSNASYSLVNMAQRWRCTYDPEYGEKIYPYVRDVADFWEDYLVWEPAKEGEPGPGRYVDYRDAIHENHGWDTNPILSLGFIHNSLDLALDMSRTLGKDADRREKWEHIIKHLSGFSTHELAGKTVFRYTEKGMAWFARGGTLGIQHIYPANSIGLDSHPDLLKIALNTATVMQRWHDSNGASSFFPAAVRIGYDPKTILAQLRGFAAKTYANGFITKNPHGIENCSVVPNTINEMLCMSHVSVGKAHLRGKPETQKKSLEGLSHLLRLFPVWPKERDASFVNIRCWGAFLVSSELKDGAVQYVKVESERGRDCHVLNPWPGQKVVVTRNGPSATSATSASSGQASSGQASSGRAGSGQAKKAETVSGERFTLKTAPGETLTLSRQDPAHGDSQ